MKTVFDRLQGEFTKTWVLGGHSAKKLIFIFAIMAITSVYSFAATDVLFLIDSTGSMSGLDTLKTALDGILAASNADSGCSDTIMYGVADYRNYTDGGNYQAYGVNLVQPFTSSILTALSAIAGLTAGGGVDAPESQLKAMVTITENWLTTDGDLGFNGRANAQKILIWSGDAPGHIAGDEAGASGPPPAGYYPSLDETIDALTSQWIMVFALNSSGDTAGLDELYSGHYQAGEITAATGGMLFNNAGSGGSEIEDSIVEAITCYSLEKDDDLDDENPSDCRSPNQELTYTICYSNDGDQTLEDAYIIDRLPVGVTYPEAEYSFGYDPTASPPIIIYPPNPGYLYEDHAYIWEIGDMDPNEFGCLELSVVVNEGAAPGTYLHNVAELWGTVYVPDPNDPNSLVPELRLIARAVLDTPVCCYITPPQVLFVDETAIDGAQTGVDWQNAFLTLQDAIQCAEAAICGEVESIYVAQGTYSPGDSEDDSFDLISLSGISVFGGFTSGGCPFEERNPYKYKTILTGRIDETHRTDTVVKMADNTRLDGFTITDAGVYGVYGNGVHFALSNSVIENNERYGLRAIDGNVNVKWCKLLANKLDGIFHEGEGFTLEVENTWVRQSARYGVYCIGSTPIVMNSIISESDMSEAGNAGIRMFNPTYSPVLQNVTVAHNRAVGLALAGTNLPVLDNLIVYHNNTGGDQFSGFGRGLFYYSCVYDPNDPNGVDLTPDENFTFSADPKLAFFDPNNIRIDRGSPCRDAGNPALNYDNQLDMDSRVRVMEVTADMGAYEVNLFDLDVDGRVNLYEFGVLASVWRAHDPDDPAITDPEHPDHEYVTDPESPGYIHPEALALWDPDGERCNFSIVGYSQYAIDLADLAAFVEGAPWPLAGGWQQEGTGGQMMMFAGGEGMQVVGFEAMALEAKSVSETPALQQMDDLVNIVGQLERIWLTDPGIQQDIDTGDWQRFMEELYGQLIEAYLSIQMD